MNYWLIFVGCLFLFNPSINLIDVLPDFIGILLIMKGMYRLSDMNNYIGAAFPKMRASLFVSLGKFAALFLIGTLDTTMILIISFASGVLECAFMIPAFVGLFEGMEYLSVREIDKGIADTSLLRKLTVVFLIIRAAGSFLPGVTAMLLRTSNGYVQSESGMSFDMLGIVLNAVFAVAIGVLGIIWLVRIFSLAKQFAKCDELNAVLEKRYAEEILGNREIMTRRRVRRFTLTAFLSAIPLLTFTINSYWVVPEFLFGVLIAVSTWISGEYGKSKKLRIFSIAYSAVAVLQYVSLFIYSDLADGDTYDSYAVAVTKPFFVPAFVTVLAVSFAACILMALTAHSLSERMGFTIDDSVGLQGEYTDERRMDLDNAKKKQLKKKVLVHEIMTYVYCALEMLVTATMPLYDLQSLWIVKFVFAIAMLIQWFVITRQISEEAENAL